MTAPLQLQHDPDGRPALAEPLHPAADLQDLTPPQQARVEIAQAACELVATVDANGLRVVPCLDLISVAQYIETGADPWTKP